MALSTYKVLGGFGIFGQASILSGSGAVPGGDSSLQDAATLGSIYLRTDTSKLYQKIGTANTTADWIEIPNVNTVTSMINSSNPSISWREPADTVDATTYANIGAVQTAYNSSNTSDGVTITSGFRVLLTELTTGNKNVYNITGTTGAWTLTEDPNSTTTGDEIYIKSGTEAGNVWVYDGTIWKSTSGVNITNELAYIRTFIGKSTAGNVTPNYSSTNFVTNATSAVTAISALDSGIFTAIGDRTYTTPTWLTSSQSVTASLQALDSGLTTAIGDRTYSSPNFVTSGQSLTASIQALDTAGAEYAFIRTYVGKAAAGSSTPTYSSTNYVTNATSLTTAIGALDSGVFSAIGNRTYTTPTYVTNGQSLTASIQALDTALTTTAGSVTTLTNILGVNTTNAVTTATVVDSANCRNYNAVRWLVTCVNASSAANKQAVEIYALHNGTASVDASTTDYNVGSMLVVGTSPTGLAYSITLTGTGASQVMNLVVTSTTSVNVKTVRTRV